MMDLVVLLDYFGCPNTDYTLDYGFDELGFIR
jgi:hypothetical protein